MTRPDVEVSLPRVWFEDAEKRELGEQEGCGWEVVRRGKRLVRVRASLRSLRNLLGDAKLYADPVGLDPEFHDVSRSARSAVRRLERAIGGGES